MHDQSVKRTLDAWERRCVNLFLAFPVLHTDNVRRGGAGGGSAFAAFRIALTCTDKKLSESPNFLAWPKRRHRPTDLKSRRLRVPLVVFRSSNTFQMRHLCSAMLVLATCQRWPPTIMETCVRLEPAKIIHARLIIILSSQRSSGSLPHFPAWIFQSRRGPLTAGIKLRPSDCTGQPVAAIFALTRRLCMPVQSTSQWDASRPCPYHQGDQQQHIESVLWASADG